jgi:two-component system, OmpR family, response regulator
MEAVSRACGERPRVLVVDDEANIRELLSSALGINGFDVRTAASGSGSAAVLGPLRRQPPVLRSM